MGSRFPSAASGPSTSRGAAGTARGPAATVPVCGGLLCPAVVAVTRGSRSPPGAAGEDAGGGQAGRAAAAAAGGHHPALRAPRFQTGGHEAAPGTGPGGERCSGAGSGGGRGTLPGVTVTASGRPEARGPALRAAAAEALLPLARRLHDLGAGGGHGEGTVRGSRGARVRRGDSAVPVPQVWEGYNVVRCTRAMVGDSSAVGTIRGDLSVHITR